MVLGRGGNSSRDRQDWCRFGARRRNRFGCRVTLIVASVIEIQQQRSTFGVCLGGNGESIPAVLDTARVDTVDADDTPLAVRLAVTGNGCRGD